MFYPIFFILHKSWGNCRYCLAWFSFCAYFYCESTVKSIYYNSKVQFRLISSPLTFKNLPNHRNKPVLINKDEFFFLFSLLRNSWRVAFQIQNVTIIEGLLKTICEIKDLSYIYYIIMKCPHIFSIYGINQLKCKICFARKHAILKELRTFVHLKPVTYHMLWTIYYVLTSIF